MGLPPPGSTYQAIQGRFVPYKGKQNSFIEKDKVVQSVQCQGMDWEIGFQFPTVIMFIFATTSTQF